MKVSLHSPTLRESLRCLHAPRTTPPARQIIHATTKHFSTSPKVHAQESIKAAEPIRYIYPDPRLDAEDAPKPHFARLLPTSRSYFTAQPSFVDNFLRLQALDLKYSSLPRIDPADMPRVAWDTLADYKNVYGENIRAGKYARLLGVLNRLNRIHPSMMPQAVEEAIKPYKRQIDPFVNIAKTKTVDKFGRGLGAGRRKTSTARAWLVEGTGEVLINGKTLAEAFSRVHDRESVIWALKATNRIDKYNVWGLCNGGGTTGQAEALALAVGKALLVHEPALKPAVRRCESLFLCFLRSMLTDEQLDV